MDSSRSSFPLHHRLDDALALRTRACLLALLQEDSRAEGICPSDAARALGREFGVEWRDLMRPVRLVIAELAREGRLVVLQDGKPVDILGARGPVRLHAR